jgi:hypothetical protein
VSRRCRQSRRVLPYVDGDLAAHDAVLFEDHLEECASCCHAVAAQRTLEERLLALPRPNVLLADRVRLHAAIGARIAAGATAAVVVAPRRAWRRPLLAAAGVLLVASLALVAWRAKFATTRTPSPEAPPEVAIATPPALPAPPAASAPVAPAERTAIELEHPVPSLALLATARDEIARCIAHLPDDGDPVALFAAETKTLRASGVPVVQLLEQVLRDPDPALGAKAADLFARAARSNRLGPEDPGLVPILEAVMRRPDRGAAMLRTIVAIGSPRAWAAINYACQMPHVRHDALVAIAGRKDTLALPKLQLELHESLRRGERADVADALGALAATTDAHAHLLAELVRAGAESGVVADALERARPDATAALIAMLAQRGDARRDALLLAPLCGGAELVAPLAELAARGDDSAAAADALARVGGAETIAAFARLAGDPSLSRSRARTVANAFAALLAASDDLRGELAAAALELRDDERSRAALLDLCLAAPDAAGARARIGLLACTTLASADRTRLVAELVNRRERVAPAELLPILAEAGARRAEERRDDRLVASLLLLLYATGGDERLMEGVRALGVDLTAAREQRLRTTARALVRSPAAPRELARLDALLELAP